MVLTEAFGEGSDGEGDLVGDETSQTETGDRVGVIEEAIGFWIGLIEGLSVGMLNGPGVTTGGEFE